MLRVIHKIFSWIRGQACKSASWLSELFLQGTFNKSTCRLAGLTPNIVLFMSLLRLSDFGSPNNLSPMFRIESTVMDYLGIKPPAYSMIREIVLEVFNQSQRLSIRSSLSDISFKILYQSPHQENPTQAVLVLMAESHIPSCRQWNSLLLDKMMVPQSILLGEGMKYLSEPITGQGREGHLKQQLISWDAEDHLLLNGWDDHHDVVENYEAIAEDRPSRNPIHDKYGNIRSIFLRLRYQDVQETLTSKQKIIAADAMEMQDAREFPDRTDAMCDSIKKALSYRTTKLNFFRNSPCLKTLVLLHKLIKLPQSPQSSQRGLYESLRA